MIHTIVDSPVGELLLVGDGTALTGLYTAEHVRRPLPPGERSEVAFGAARSQLAEYFAGDRLDFDLPLNPVGTAFQRSVWDLLTKIPHGRTQTYGQLALELGNPKAVRAVGLANGRNPISIIVPCHRVIGSDGKLTGYAGGLAAKQWLLDHERQALSVN